MKTIPTRPLVGLALTCLALAGPASLLAGNTFVISTFDSDLGSHPYGTNLWADGAGVAATSSVYFTNSGNPAGAMAMDFNFTQGTAQWQWQDYQITVQPFGVGLGGDGKGTNMGIWDFIEFDIAINTNHSVVNTSYANNPYGGIGVIGQGDPGWGDNSTNAFPTGDPLTWHQFGGYIAMPGTNGWFHVKIPVQGGFGSQYGNTLNRLILQCFEFPDTNQATKAEFLVDNVQFTALGVPPTMTYQKAVRGLNFWLTGGANDRNSISTYQDNVNYWYMWAGTGGPTRYAFTLTNWPSGAAQTAVLFRMDLVPTFATEGAPDWNEPNCIMTEVGVDTNGNALWYFRWKTNSPNGNGQYYDANAQISITNPGPLGTWTLTFDNTGAGVTMTTPNGNSTNFVMGMHPNVPDIQNSFIEATGNQGEVYLGLLGGNTNVIDQKVVLASAVIKGNISSVSNNFMADLTLTNPATQSVFVPVANVQWYIVPATNAMWVNWTVPDGGFSLQTNTVGLNSANWSTNHGLPSATLFATHKGLLVKPGDLPNTPKLFFRMSSPGY